MALRLEGVWEELGRPSRFTVLEAGAGRGWLGRDLLAAAQGPFASALRYLHRDDNPAARRAAEEALAPWLATGQACLVGEAETLEPFVGAVISNELFDALPAQPWRWRGGGWEREVLTSEGSAWQTAESGEAGAWFSAQGSLEPGDGILLCLLASEILAVTGKTPSQRYAELEAEFGASAYQRVDAPATPAQKAALSKLAPDAVAATALAGEPITAKLSHAPGNGAAIGGLKVQTEHAWFAARPSGTEDVYKLYAESLRGPEHLAEVQAEARAVVAEALGSA